LPGEIRAIYRISREVYTRELSSLCHIIHRGLAWHLMVWSVADNVLKTLS
jgi:hypothetical protein